MTPSSFKKAHFVSAFIARGLSYAEAQHAYDAMLSVFETGIIGGNRITLGRVGTLTPVWLEPKVVHMGFTRSKDDDGSVSIKKDSKREYILGRRVKFKFNLHRAFMRKHDFNWFV
jgi:hypothetical protein